MQVFEFILELNNVDLLCFHGIAPCSVN
jgi:hypothetical protein